MILFRHLDFLFVLFCFCFAVIVSLGGVISLFCVSKDMNVIEIYLVKMYSNVISYDETCIFFNLY